MVVLIDKHAQLQELKQRASGNVDESFVNPGISEKQPLHVVMVSIISLTVTRCFLDFPSLFNINFVSL